MDKLKPVSAFPTGEKDKDFKITPKEAEQLKSAFAKPEFREMFNAYMEEMNDPKNREETAQYFKQLEEEGELQNQVYVDPKIGYCFTSKDTTGLRVHVNITHSEDMAEMTEVHGRDPSGNQAAGTSYQVPHGLTQPKDWKDEGEKCKVIDVAVNTRVYERATSNNKFLAFINNIASEALKKNFNITLTDVAGAKVKRNHYKGGSQPEAIMIPKKSASASGRKKPVVNAENSDPNSSGNILNPNKPGDETVDLKGLGEELYKSHMGGDAPMSKSEFAEQFMKDKLKEKHGLAENKPLPNYDITGMKKGFLKSGVEVPSHKVVESGSFEMHEHMKLQPDAVSTRPKNLLVKVELPKIDSARDLDVDVVDNVFKLEVPKKYKLSVQLKYPVKGDDAKAKFDKTRKLLTVTIPVEEQGSIMLKPSEEAVDSTAAAEEEEAPLPQTSSLVQEITPEERQAMEEKKIKEQEAAEMKRREEALAAKERELSQSAEFSTRRTSEQELKRQQARAEKDARRRAVMEQKEKEEEEKRLAEEAAARAEREAAEAIERARVEEEERVAREQEEAARQEREAEEAEAERKRQEFKKKWEESERELDAVKDEYVEKLKREKEEAEAKEAEKRRLAQEASELKAKKELEEKTREAEEKTKEVMEKAKDAKKMSDKEREREEERRQDKIRDEMFTAAPKPLIPNHPRTGTDFEIAMQYVPLAYYTASNLYGDVQFRLTDSAADSFTLRIGTTRDEPEIIAGLTTVAPTFVMSLSKDNFTRLVSGKTDMGSLIYDKSCVVNDIAKVKVFENAFDFLEASYHSFVTGGIDFGMNKFRKLHEDENTKKEVMVLDNDILLELA